MKKHKYLFVACLSLFPVMAVAGNDTLHEIMEVPSATNINKNRGQLVRERCGCRVTLENDGKAAAIAELRAGALQGCCNAAVFIIGTGVGGGIIANGQLVRGVHFTAGE